MIGHACLARRFHRIFGISDGALLGRARRASQTRFNSSLTSLTTSSDAPNDEDNATYGRRTRQVYWFSPDLKSPSVELPSGKQCFVFNAKRDQDGELEPVLCFVDRHGRRLMWMDAEELREFEKLIPRLEEYFKLYSPDENFGTDAHATND
ncbi:hypothetical protein, conserved [Eimeria acervulina]|uniref:Uncharacterized protein n=1 Tax=Eimeria acervulina TaxID=5801 RepID=U6GBK0_EIMAC|nr:hypothetical protein, conserved [Eimeria acervulina]CDI76922.1 hypothetical protein, conserved [Eimeria acervulina]